MGIRVKLPRIIGLVVLAVLMLSAAPADALSKKAMAKTLRNLAIKEQNNSLRYLHTTWFRSAGYRYAAVPVTSIVEASSTAGVTGSIEVLRPPAGFSTIGSSETHAKAIQFSSPMAAAAGPVSGSTRMQASVSYATALALANGTYSAKRVGVSRAEALRRTVAWTNGLALSHARGEWGENWQSALWTFYLGAGSKRIWNSLPVYTQELVAKAVAAEADRLLAIPPPYYKDATGRVLTPGDSKAEEDAWNAGLLFLAARMYASGDPVKASQWDAQARWYALVAFATPDQVGKDGRIRGSNINSNGTLINHSIIHPDYMVSPGEMKAKGLIVSGWTRTHLPSEFSNRSTTMWHGLTAVKFHHGPYRKPGGTIYRTKTVRSHGKKRKVATANIYYPQGTDWSTVRRHNIALMDVAVFVSGHTYAYPWGKAHIGFILKQQARHKDGHIFSKGSTRFAGDEQFAGACAAEMVETLGLVR